MGGAAIVNTRLTALLMVAPRHTNNVSQTELIFAVDIILHAVSLTWFFKINANTHNAYKKRLAGYYPPAENEDKSTVAYYTETILFSVFQRQDNQKKRAE